ncbi:mRNA cleavage and polyadenylation specificity factor complex subunit [Myriangium duriaei CBS 260.36]|uniref:mRNA cleavage and polyadenylation specificity factor complex subunit n=1 Tax=Myriangium duriaei CBS 260.36 TaxID=1168546 RepID=A0A9P4MEN3_9PEZI|nr:mRNA cleavage and polyadenylation specificity factor complex subunit [Myriangium duriaei CBS 260.36]
MTATTNAADTIRQLNQARNLCLADPNNLYAQIIPGLSPIINAGAELELRRWGTDFLSETFSSPVLAPEQKQKLSIQVLEGLKGYLDKPDEDALVVKSVVQTAASIYQFVVRHIIANPSDTDTWQKMTAIKSSILRRMDNAPAGVRLCCVKFIQKVVQVQTPGMIADPRRPDQNEISLALVPRDHPVIPYSNLEAEASGLLDRLLTVIQDNSSDALVVTATLNSLAALVRGRASIANKIVNAVLNFNPFTLAQSQAPISIKNKLLIRSMTRTTMSFLLNIIKKNPQHQLAGRIHGTLDRMRQSLVDVFDESRRKRPAPDEPTDGLSDAKRQRLGAEVAMPAISNAAAPFPPTSGPVTFAQLFTLTDDNGLRNFDVKSIPIELVTRIVPPLLASIDAAKLDAAINTVRSRFLKLSQPRPRDATAAAKVALGAGADEDDDYEPDGPVPDQEQILNALDQASTTGPSSLQPPEAALGPYHLPQPPPLTNESAASLSKGAVTRAFATLNDLEQQVAPKTAVKGFHRLAATNHDRNGWVTILIRLATRTSNGLDYDQDESKSQLRRQSSASEAIRDALYRYFIDDFRRRIDIGIAWLNEEWYNDKVAAESTPFGTITTNGNTPKQSATPHYNKWLYKIIDGFLPFLDAKDRLLIRFLSEIPSMDNTVVSRVVKLAADPDRVNLAIQALHYLVLYRPPVKEICLDGVEDLWRNYEDAKNPAQKLLVKYRPSVVEQSMTNGNVAIKAEG